MKKEERQPALHYIIERASTRPLKRGSSTKRPHTVMSLALAVLGTWTFVLATNSLSKQFFANVAYVGWVTELLQFAFVFLTAWQPAANVSASAVTGDDNAAA